MNPRRILLTWGFVWLLLSMGVGLYLGPQVHTTREAKEAHFEKALGHLAAHETDAARTELKAGMKLAGDSGDRATLHSHIACMAFLALLVGLVLPFMGLSRKWKLILSWVIVAGSFFHGVGVLVEQFHLTAGMALAVLGAPLLILGVITSFIGIVKFVSRED